MLSVCPPSGCETAFLGNLVVLILCLFLLLNITVIHDNPDSEGPASNFIEFNFDKEGLNLG